MGTKESDLKQKLETRSQLKQTFFKAVKSGNVEEVRKLIEKGCDITWKDVNDDSPSSDCLTGATALHYACEKGHTELVNFLLNLNQNANINEYDDSLWTPLHYAVDGGHSTVVEILVQKGADILKPGMCMGNEPPGTPIISLKMTPFHMAADQSAKKPDIYQMLSKTLSNRGIDLSKIPPNIFGHMPFDCIKNPSKRQEEFEALFPQMASEEAQSGLSLFQGTAGILAMSGRSPTLLFSSTSSSPSSSLPYKVTDSHDSDSSTELDKGPRKNLEKKEQAEISKLEQPQDIRPFLERCKVESDGDKLPEPGLAFRRAAAAGLETVTRALAENDKSLDINQPGAESGKTALHFAVIKGKKNVVSQLLGMGAKSDIEDAQGKTASVYAAESADEGIKKLFAVKY